MQTNKSVIEQRLQVMAVVTQTVHWLIPPLRGRHEDVLQNKSIMDVGAC